MRSPRQDAVIIGVLTVPFLLNDFANVFLTDYRAWLMIDYGFVKAFPLGVIFYLLRTKRISYSDLGAKSVRPGPFIVWTLATTISGIVLDQFGSRFFATLLPDTKLGEMPPITNPLINQIDLHFGLALVAVVEEVIFRGMYFTVLSRYLRSVVPVFTISALAFGLIHWSLGLGAIVHTAIIGTVFMVCVWRQEACFPQSSRTFAWTTWHFRVFSTRRNWVQHRTGASIRER